MSNKVITLDGLPTKSVSSKSCGNLVNIHSSVTGEDFKVCETDLPRFQGNGASVVAKKRGRPKGTTVMAGARRPKAGTCQRVERVKTKRGIRCRCTSPHKQFVKCGQDGRQK